MNFPPVARYALQDPRHPPLNLIHWQPATKKIVFLTFKKNPSERLESSTNDIVSCRKIVCSYRGSKEIGVQ